jgi:hypothetical protein
MRGGHRLHRDRGELTKLHIVKSHHVAQARKLRLATKYFKSISRILLVSKNNELSNTLRCLDLVNTLVLETKVSSKTSKKKLSY